VVASFTLTDLDNRSGEVVEAAFGGPVDITKRGKRKFVLLTAQQFDRLTGSTA
jgi:antitoxin Phd